MQVLVVNSKDDKNLSSAYSVLKILGYDVEIDDSLSVFNKAEAEFRIENISLDEESLEIYNNLTEQEQQSIISDISIKYDESDILDYDLLDDIVRDCFEEFIENKRKEV